MWGYSLMLLLALVVGAPYWLARMVASERHRAGLRGRLGRVPKELVQAGDDAATAGKSMVWLHAVSVGEVLAATTLVKELKAAGLAVAVSTTTQAGQDLAKKRMGAMGCAVFYMPLDFAVLVRRYIGALRPKLVVTMESELWPNVIWECKKAGVPLAVVNARVSDRSFPRYMRLRGLWGQLLREVSLFMAQSEETAERLRRMGVPAEHVRVTGNLKYDVRSGTATAMTERIHSLLYQSRLVVAGSTLADEEAVLLEAWPKICEYAPDAALLIAPRHPDRFVEVAELVKRSGFPFFRCSEIRADAGPITGGMVVVLDTIGDLGSMYLLGAVAFVGGSVVEKGGHNPLEPAQFGVPVVMGESSENFREIVGAMKDAGGIRIVERKNVGEALASLLSDKESARRIGERGRAVFEAQSGSTARTVAGLMELMEARP
jgi:3-deoxy-D-manno-octulosonic-acid transferase